MLTRRGSSRAKVLVLGSMITYYDRQAKPRAEAAFLAEALATGFRGAFLPQGRGDRGNTHGVNLI